MKIKRRNIEQFLITYAVYLINENSVTNRKNGIWESVLFWNIIKENGMEKNQ